VKNRCVFLDRDGVINYPLIKNNLPYSPRNMSEIVLYPDLKFNLQLLRQAGFILIIVTNQPDISRGDMTINELHNIHNFILSKHEEIADIYVCIHDDKDNCNCRKPKHGLLLEACVKYSLSLPNSYIIGDRWKDIQAGNIAGCKSVFINYNYSEKQPTLPFYEVTNLSNAVKYILKED